MAKAPSQYIETSGAARTRTADALSLTQPLRPQALTVYLRFIELGGVSETTGEMYWLAIGAGAPHVLLYRPSGSSAYRFRHANAASQVACTISTSLPTFGQLVELCGQVYADGHVQLHISINGGTVASGTASGALVFATAWSSTAVYVGQSSGGSTTLVAFRDLLIVRGVHDMVTMRLRAGV